MFSNQSEEAKIRQVNLLNYWPKKKKKLLTNLFKHSIMKDEPFALIIESDSNKISFQCSVPVQDITNLKKRFYVYIVGSWGASQLGGIF